MTLNVHKGLNITEGTFQMHSQYPDLEMPWIKADDANLLKPTHASKLLDGEWVRVGQGTSQGSVALVGMKRIFALAAGNMPFTAAVGPDTFEDYNDGGTLIHPPTQLRPVRLRGGRGDTQASGGVPVIADNRNWRAHTRLIDDTATYNIGDPLFVEGIANADLPAYVQGLSGRATIYGLIPRSAVEDRYDFADDVQIYAVGTVTGTKDANGWIEFEFSPRLVTITGG